jgi:hypothetical protein
MQKFPFVTFASVLLALTPVLVHAQSAVPAPAPARKGFVIGFSLGAGSASCGSCETKTGGAGTVHIGGMLTPRLALLYDVGVVTFTHNRVDYAHVVGGATLQYFVRDRVWVKGGIGVAELVVADTEGKTRLGLLAAVGADIHRRNRFAVDLSARVAVGRHPGNNIRNLSAQLGVTWY